MMAFTTLLIAIPISLMLYFWVIKKVKKPLFSYVAIILISLLFFMMMSLHLIYIGLEVLIIGLTTVFVRSKYLARKDAASN